MSPSDFLDKLMGRTSGYDARIRPNFKGICPLALYLWLGKCSWFGSDRHWFVFCVESICFGKSYSEANQHTKEKETRFENGFDKTSVALRHDLGLSCGPLQKIIAHPRSCWKVTILTTAHRVITPPTCSCCGSKPRLCQTSSSPPSSPAPSGKPWDIQRQYGIFNLFTESWLYSKASIQPNATGKPPSGGGSTINTRCQNQMTVLIWHQVVAAPLQSNPRSMVWPSQWMHAMRHLKNTYLLLYSFSWLTFM